MSTPTDGKEVVMEKGEASIDEKYDDWIAKADEMVEWLYDYYYMHFRPTLEEKIADMEYQIDMCIHALKVNFFYGLSRKKTHSIQFLK